LSLRQCGIQRLETGQIAAGQALIEQAIAVATQIHAGDMEFMAINDLGLMQGNQGRVAEARGTFLKALELARQLEEPVNAATPQLNVASADVDLASPDAEQELVAAGAVTRQVGLKTTARLCDVELAVLHHRLGHLSASRKEWEQVLAEIRADGDRLFLASQLVVFADTLVELGDRDAAEKTLREANALGLQMGAHDTAAISRSQLAAMASEPKDFDRVVAEEREAAEELVRSSEWDGAAWAYLRLARSLRSRGKLEEARQAIALARAQQTEVVFTVLEVEVESARLDARQGMARLEAVRHRAERVHYPQPVLEARQAMAELEQSAGNRGRARSVRTTVARDARELGYERIARQASAP
jgi:tetratricopeptide (TPR) repeat protein